MVQGKSVRLFLVDGSPGGLVTAEIMNWTGHVITAPRTQLPALMRRSELARTGVYLLLGDDADSPGKPALYVGEGDVVKERLYQHNRDDSKDFFDRVAVLTSKDENLTKAHARYLESRFIALAADAGRSTLRNGTAPAPLPLPESDRSDMESYIEQAKIVLPVLGINVLRSTRAGQPAGAAVSGEQTASAGVPSPVLRLSVKGADATAQVVDGEFVVREGSLARPTWTGSSATQNYLLLRQHLEEDGSLVLVEDGARRRFTRDAVFASASAAASVVLGRNSNGRLEWKVDGTKQSYGEWEESLLPPAAPTGEE